MSVSTYARQALRRFGWLALLLATSVQAIDSLQVELGDLQGEAWQAQGVHLHIALATDSSLAGEIRLERLALPDPIGRIDDLRIECERLVHDAAGTECRGRLAAGHLLGEPIRSRIALRHAADSGRLQIELSELTLAGGRWRIDARLTAAGWTVELEARAVAGEALVALARRLGQGVDYQVQGRIDLEARLQGAANALEQIRFDLRARQFEFANPVGTQAGEQLQFEMAGQLRRQAADWQAELQGRFEAGALFVDPLYFEFNPERVAQIDLSGAWSAGRSLQLSAVQLRHAGVAEATGSLRLGLDPVRLEAIDLHIARAQLPAAFDTYIQPWIRGQLGDVIQTAGRFSGHYSRQGESDSRLHLVLEDVAIDDPQQRFAVTGLAGVIDWASDDQLRTTELGWRSGSVYRLSLGAARLAVESRGTSFELREPVEVPLLDGRLHIEDLAMSDPGGEAMRWRFDGVLTPVSMEAVSAALDWPRFGGQLSGMIPSVSYADNRLELGGVLLIKAFDGALTVRNLHLEEPFGRVPRLRADLQLDNLDLAALTETFSFGKIEGRLDGRVDNLRLQDWEPVAFDARFATPEDDRSRHRISQKAVDNLSSIGGGVGGVLSRSFLGVFEEFPYDRLGLSCRLENGVCAMGGVAPAKNGYYIVKGRFLPPRIDVVGYADRVDWHTLIDRLKAVTLEQGPRIE